MTVERKLQIVVSVMSLISTSLIGLGRFRVDQPLFMLIAVIAANIFSDRLGWLRLNRVVANIAMLAATVVPLMSFFRSDTENQLSEIGGLLTSVQIVLFFQAKNPRVYGSLAIFSLLQVVVAALLSSGLEFGILVVMYLVASILFLALSCAYRETYRLSVQGSEGGKGSADNRIPPPVRGWQKLLHATPVIDDRASMAEFDRRFLGARLLGGASAICLPTILLAAVFFYAAPRSSRSSWQRQVRWSSATVGFSRRVNLNVMADLMQNDTPVMRVSFSQRGSKKPIEILGGAYFYGAALSDYSPDGAGTWRQGTTGGGDFLPDAPSLSGLTYVDILLEPSRENTLFAVWPVYDVKETPPRIRIEQNTRRLFRSVQDELMGRNHQFRYVAATTSIRNGDQATLTPFMSKWDKAFSSTVETWPAMKFDFERLGEVQAIANKVLAESEVDRSNRTAVARALEGYLSRGEEFHYSLDLGRVARNRQIDPVVDFLVNHRTGVCTHFASALALMLRSQGIPSRLVVGYKGGEFNALGGYYRVRQRDAHAWVEAHVPTAEIEADDLPPGETATEGAWLRLDPTPPSRDRAQQYYERTLVDRMGEILDYAQMLWTDHVLRLNRDRQTSAIYRRVVDQADSAVDVLDGNSLRRSIRRFLFSLGVPRNSFLMRLLSLNTVIVFGVVGMVIWLAWRWLGFTWRQRPRRESAQRTSESQVDFYRRWEKLLQAHGLKRPVGQTPREFGLSAFSTLSKNRSELRVPVIAETIVGAFYRVRFGQATLDKTELESIEHALHLFEQDLRQKTTHRTAAHPR